MDSKMEQLLQKLLKCSKDALQENYIGFYVHGSLAMSGFNPEKSDVDFIIVCREEPDASVKKKLIDACEMLWDEAPAKGLEMHLLLQEDCLHPSEEPKFVLHYSAMHRQSFQTDPMNYIGYMHGEDPDLNAHITVLRARGICIDGAPISEVFGEVSRKNYVRALLEDAEWDSEDALYHVLNSARCLAYMTTGQIYSKREGTVWAIQHMPEYGRLLSDALRCCDTDETLPASEDAETFCEKAADELKRLNEECETD